ncbi:acyl-CoA dehydrogenase family protein [Streptomyces sp. NPDC050535]|uniref:acyl-CoA dehydrogenase family protein n=1 Tax=Streptomyces sp. NPDC050535 TaxID=3365626 RepID=UPI0037BA8BC4
MDARFTAEQEEIRRTLRELLVKRCGLEEVRAAVRSSAGYDSALWDALAQQLGLPGLALPEAYGGVGCSVTELALACEESGRALAPSPLLATAVLAAPLILALGTGAQRAELLPRLASGELTAALAVPGARLPTALGLVGDNDGDWAGGGRSGGVQARRVDGGWRLYGQAAQVLDGHSAELLVVAAHTGGFVRTRTLLFLVRAQAGGALREQTGAAGRARAEAVDGLVRIRQTALDETRPLARVELRDVAAELLGDEDADVAGALAGAGDVAAAVLAAEAVGAADRALERTVEYVRQREQFGRAIGSFQAVKHRLADVYVGVQAARSAAYYAAWAAGTGAGGERVGGLALAQALESLRTAASEGIQLHGGIGFTWEHEAHLYFKRAAGDELLFGPVHRLRGHAADMAHLFDCGADGVSGSGSGSRAGVAV